MTILWVVLAAVAFAAAALVVACRVICAEMRRADEWEEKQNDPCGNASKTIRPGGLRENQGKIP